MAFLLTALSLLATMAVGCGGREPARDPLLLQGAMPIETDVLVAALTNPAEQQVQGWTFWTGTLDGHPVVVSKTLKGMANAAAATALAIAQFSPGAIVNQGTAGGHDPALQVRDLVIGTAAANIGAFKTGARGIGEGSDFAGWQPLDLNRSEGSAGQDPDAWVMRRFPADGTLLDAAARVKDRYRAGRVVEGVISSSDMWNSELDRIRHLHDVYGTSVEDMETAAVAQIAAARQVPFLGIRVLSNNITNAGAYDGGSARACQEFVLEVARAWIARRAVR
jgi:adenosylhomocysteine nucleosidase